MGARRQGGFPHARRAARGVGYGPAPKDGGFAKWGSGFEVRYAPGQPRVPAGSAQGGQWTSGGGGGGVSGSVSFRDAPASGTDPLGGTAEQIALNIDPSVASDLGGALHKIGERLLIDLTEENAQGGHPLERHVARTHEQLIKRADRNRIEIVPAEFWEDRVGSFHNLFTANQFVNEVLAQFWPTVEAVAKGAKKKIALQAWCDRPTGYESYRRRFRDPVIIRQTTGVVVVIRHDPRLKKGFVLLTVCPNNPSE